ncbi:very-long-chain (3R)-3-hydroxyacyl-CoA dehydratase hpo-8 [Diabrotica virgifera virgifera]|uniref:Very-long-chain (3R)-3-hydroxyacyl-CoA dehydratase n=1 Tax=Diabrotica virgifera virgifera TaxID=50390 RepID=A0A6P7F4B1_DIAVI|nr:very-long-chain (3R)-3-hydroxyacyl-CoA dehydratase hpo-8 [Diabrotica virgifera virgifera]
MAKESASKKGNGAVTTYLLLYNGIQTLGWSYLLFQVIIYYLFGSTKSLYDTVQWTVNIFQNLAVLEVLHAAIGIVKSNPIITAVQVSSRVVVVVGVLIATQAPRESIGLTLCLLAWSITEIIRYSMYALSLVNAVPYFLTWLRYSLFVVLYPIGITGELLCLFWAQKEVGENSLYSVTMPHKYNFIFNYQHVLVFIMLMYIPFFPQLYGHMFAQRKKVLGGKKKE